MCPRAGEVLGCQGRQGQHVACVFAFLALPLSGCPCPCYCTCICSSRNVACACVYALEIHLCPLRGVQACTAEGHDHDHKHHHHHHHKHERGETRAAQRFGIRNFVYSRRRPFHPQRCDGVQLTACLHGCRIKDRKGVDLVHRAKFGLGDRALRGPVFVALRRPKACCCARFQYRYYACGIMLRCDIIQFPHVATRAGSRIWCCAGCR